ncbi:hypothetical protein EDD21DRAFT_393315 [Dissophora ornata]|nr:hypothetical protein EDD21DRAFT_393315 [Dissophora ornata]
MHASRMDSWTWHGLSILYLVTVGQRTLSHGYIAFCFTCYPCYFPLTLEQVDFISDPTLLEHLSTMEREKRG